MRRSTILASAAALALLVPFASSAGSARIPDPATEIGIPAGADVLDYQNDKRGRLTVPVMINGSGPFQFFVDTGSERTVIAKELAKALNLGPGPRQRMHSLTETSNVSTVIIPRLGLSRRTVHKIAAPALAQVHLGAEGMLGIDSLKSQHVVFDFAGRKMAFAPSREGRAARRGDDDEIVVTARTRVGRLVLADAAVHGSRVTVILDTGAEVSVGNEALRRRLMRTGKLREMKPIRLVSVTGADIAANYTTIGQVTIGGLQVSDMPVAFGDVRLFNELDLTDKPAILLGMDMLSRFDRVAVDFARREVRFRLPRDPAKLPG
jgi:predicted aspartyl protease